MFYGICNIVNTFLFQEDLQRIENECVHTNREVDEAYAFLPKHFAFICSY